jgi:hypothetical protein
LIGHFATEWQRVLPPHQHTVMAYTTTKPDYTLSVTIDCEDEAGYQCGEQMAASRNSWVIDRYRPPVSGIGTATGDGCGRSSTA